MGSFRYRHRVKLAPGFSLNLNKKSVSVTGGVRRTNVTKSVGGRSTYSAGVPGSGLSYRGQLGRGGTPRPRTPKQGLRGGRTGRLLIWLGGLVLLLPVAAGLAALADGLLRAFWFWYAVVAVVWSVSLLRRSRNRGDAAAPVTIAAPALSFSPAEAELRSYWKSFLDDGHYTLGNEIALNKRVHDLGLDVDESGLNSPEGRFKDLIWRSRIASIASRPLVALANPSLLTKPGEVVYFQTSGNLMRRTSIHGSALFEPNDDGLLSITSKRIVFLGQRRSLDVSFRRLNGLAFEEDGTKVGEAVLHTDLVIHDSQKTSSVYLGLGNADLAAAVAHAAIEQSGPSRAGQPS